MPADGFRDSLDRIAASPHFAGSPRLKKFLYFIVERALAGRTQDLKESVVGVEVFERDPSYDPRTDPVVRVMAGRLRERLQQYYAREGKLDEIRIELPKGGYVPQFERIHQQLSKPAQPAARLPKSRRYQLAAFLAVFAGLTVLSILAFRQSPPSTPFKVEVLTALPGSEIQPSLSPDGNLVAFQWTNGLAEGPSDIWVKAVKGETLRRITDTRDNEWSPAWSPDGREIAFVRSSQDQGSGIFVVSQLGGSERKVSDSGVAVSWGPDSKTILVRDREGDAPYGIWQIDVETRQRRRITQPSSGIGDWRFSVSPDGSTLAFVRSPRAGVGDIYVVPLGGGEPRRLTDWDDLPANVAWTPDSREVVYSVRGQLWRVPVHGRKTRGGTRIPLSAHGLVRGVTISRPGPEKPVRLVGVSSYVDISLRVVDLQSPASDGVFTAVRPLADATIPDWPGRFAPDNRRIAFASYRAGNGASLWTVDVDGGDLRRLTTAEIAELHVGSWSPDGQQIAFDAAVSGNSDIYTVRDDGTGLRRLTTETSAERHPFYSRDGRWIYFASDRTGRQEIWRMSTSGGELRQMTQGGGYEPIGSPDGRWLYYLDKPPRDGGGFSSILRLKRMPIEGGDEEFVLDSVRWGLWDVTEQGVVFLNLPGAPKAMSISVLSSASGRVIGLGSLPFSITGIGDLGRLAVSSDSRWMLTNTTERLDNDLMLIDNFR